ncbi:hypothetical protein MIS45_07150 [Wielerella bovis]|uniref:hypothetical protein n=1 Tax=Wielerella bovis TaxID=2917790 RepID=UPI0020188880|nr:hypothetical protein [Wielerella bovis]ULJ68576.1 hypothetical protein MIS45_07150 [Wielerella bovis]
MTHNFLIIGFSGCLLFIGSLKPLQNPIFGTFLRDAFLKRLPIYMICLRVLRYYRFERRSNLGFYKGFSLKTLCS